MATLPVVLKPVVASEAYAAPNPINVKKDDDAGKTITFSAENSGFAVCIPNANKLFAEWDKEYWCCSIRDHRYVETPKIRRDLDIGNKWDYYIYCEKTQDWAKDSADAPPIIIIVHN